VHDAAVGLKVVAVGKLAEIDHGAMAGLRAEEVEVAFPGALSRRSADTYRWRFPGGESHAHGDVRAAAVPGAIATPGTARPLPVSYEMIGRMVVRNTFDVATEALREISA
jgi:broad specificity phosphatase PhoE